MVDTSEPRERAGARVKVISAITGFGMMLGVGVSSADVPVACNEARNLGHTSPCSQSVDPLFSGPDGGDSTPGGLMEPEGTRIG